MDLFASELDAVPAARLHHQNAQTTDVPADVRLVAAVSRLLDFHQSRSSGGSITQPEVPSSAAANLFLATTLLRILGRIELDQGQALVSLKFLSQELSDEVPSLEEDVLEHCILSLSRSREIRYGVNTEAGVVYAHTSDSTPLLIFDGSLRQVGLTENARLLIRVSELKESWLYSDLDARRLLMALERRQFGDIPRFCREMLRDLAGKARQISDVAERPAYAELREALIQEGATISEALREAANLVHSAMQELFSPTIASAFELWKVSNSIPFELGNLQAEMENVLQVTESLSRRFVRFITEAQSAQTVRAPIVGFLDIVQSLHTRADGLVEQLETVVADLLPWLPEVSFFSPDCIAGEVSLSGLYALSLPSPPSAAFIQSEQLNTQGDQVHAFLERNAKVILDTLRHGPRPFVELITLEGLQFETDESASDFVGAYSYPEVFEIEDQRVLVVHQAGLVEISTDHSLLVTSNPILFLEEVDNEPR